MIRVKLLRDADGRMHGFDVEGHADTAPHGQDIVCAGVSALTQSALLGIGDYLKRKVDYRAGHGLLAMRLREPPDDSTEAILWTMLLGLREIAKGAPEVVQIEEVRAS